MTGVEIFTVGALLLVVASLLSIFGVMTKQSELDVSQTKAICKLKEQHKADTDALINLMSDQAWSTGGSASQMIYIRLPWGDLIRADEVKIIKLHGNTVAVGCEGNMIESVCESKVAATETMEQVVDGLSHALGN